MDPLPESDLDLVMGIVRRCQDLLALVGNVPGFSEAARAVCKDAAQGLRRIGNMEAVGPEHIKNRS